MTEHRTHAAPVTETSRIISLDVLRGVALAGILVMNIPSFAYVPTVFFNPTYSGTFFGGDRVVWMISHMLFEQKMMTIFSMLFGAGVLLMTGKAKAKGDSPLRLHARRMAWLFLFGMLHAYLIWEGDILYAYSICGFLVFFLRRLPAKWLALIGVVLIAIAVPLGTAQGWWFGTQREEVASIQMRQAAGEEPSEFEQSTLEMWNDMQSDFQPNAEQLEETEASFTGSYTDRFKKRAIDVVFFQTYIFLVWGIWRVCGVMLLGMALYKSGFLSGAWSARRYAVTAAAGYLVGLPIVALGMTRLMSTGFDWVELFKINSHFNYIGSVPVAIAHAAVVMLVLKSALGRVVRSVLATYGRMALTNYLMQSIICAIIFYGYGFGMWGQMDRVGLMGVVLAVWTAQIVFSKIWLGAFRFGPFEWVWRSLTYWTPQRMRKP